VLLVVAVALAAFYSRPLTPEAALEKFYTYGSNPDDGVAEDMTMDPLIIAGDDVVPLVTERIKDPLMPRRFVAMYFLGNGRYRSALPTLETILQSPAEEPHIRMVALESIYLIDEDAGRTLAGTFAADQAISSSAQRIHSGKYTWERRTYEDARLGRHE